MRLGFWNRLAIVASVLAILIAPTWFVVSENYKMTVAREQGYNTCLDQVYKPGSDLTRKQCEEIWEPYQAGYRMGWGAWREAAFAVAAMSAVIYALIWLAAWITRWVLRGRVDKNTDTA